MMREKNMFTEEFIKKEVKYIFMYYSKQNESKETSGRMIPNPYRNDIPGYTDVDLMHDAPYFPFTGPFNYMINSIDHIISDGSINDYINLIDNENCTLILITDRVYDFIKNQDWFEPSFVRMVASIFYDTETMLDHFMTEVFELFTTNLHFFDNEDNVVWVRESDDKLATFLRSFVPTTDDEVAIMQTAMDKLDSEYYDTYGNLFKLFAIAGNYRAIRECSVIFEIMEDRKN